MKYLHLNIIYTNWKCNIISEMSLTEPSMSSLHRVPDEGTVMTMETL